MIDFTNEYGKNARRHTNNQMQGKQNYLGKYGNGDITEKPNE